MIGRKSSVAYLDGVRGVAAFGVFVHHFTLAFYPAYFTLKPEMSHLNGYEIDYSHSFYSFLNNGGFFVAIFFVLSGFVLSRKYFRTNNVDEAISGLHRRFIRLYIPIAAAIIVSYILLTNHLYNNDAASRITLSEWFIKQWRIGQPEKRLLASLTYGTMFARDASFDTCLWTMSTEFYGSLFVYAFLVFTHYTSKYRLLMMMFALYYFFMMDSPFYVAFILGMSLNYTEKRYEKNKGSILTSIFSVSLLAIALLMASVPFYNPLPDTWQDNIKTAIWDYTPYCLIVAGYFVVLSFLRSPLLQKIASIRPFKFLGYISFSLYLLHPLLLGSFSGGLFLKLYNGNNYNNAVLEVFVATMALLLLVSWLMAKYIDQSAIRLAHKFYEYVRKPQKPEASEPQPQPAIAVKHKKSLSK